MAELARSILEEVRGPLDENCDLPASVAGNGRRIEPDDRMFAAEKCPLPAYVGGNGPLIGLEERAIVGENRDDAIGEIPGDDERPPRDPALIGDAIKIDIATQPRRTKRFISVPPLDYTPRHA